MFYALPMVSLSSGGRPLDITEMARVCDLTLSPYIIITIIRLEKKYSVRTTTTFDLLICLCCRRGHFGINLIDKYSNF